jgi:hypothetical protein
MAGTGIKENKGWIGPHEFELLMTTIGLLALLLAAMEHRRAIRSLKAQYPVTEQHPDIPRSQASVLAAIIAILGLLALFSMLFRG